MIENKKEKDKDAVITVVSPAVTSCFFLPGQCSFG